MGKLICELVLVVFNSCLFVYILNILDRINWL